MAMIEYRCPNCGASVNVSKSRVVYCEYCGSELVRKKRSGPSKKNNELYEKALFQFRFEKYRYCQETLYKALREDPDNSDLLLMDAMLREDHTILERIHKTTLSDEVVALCKRNFLRRNIKIDYEITASHLKKVKITQLKNLNFKKIELFDNATTLNYLSFAKLLLSDKEYKSILTTMEEANDSEYLNDYENLSKWKKIFKRRFWWSMGWFALTLFMFLLNAEEGSILFGTLFGLVGLGLFIFRKYHTDRLF